MLPIVINASRRTYQVSFVDFAADALNVSSTDRQHAVIDARVAHLWPELLTPFGPDRVTLVDATESVKSLAGVETLVTALSASGFSRSDTLVVIGGGVTQDVASFTASILYRGVDWIFYPTTLLSQADSCIGSKTSINFGGIKNQLGGYYPPAEVVVASDVRRTLLPDDVASGIGEIAHYLLLSGEREFGLLEDASKWQEPILTELVRQSLLIKQPYVERDEFDSGERRLLNFGHTFGHALEVASLHQLPHGIAVAFGIDIANVIACRRGLLQVGTRNRVRSALEPIWQRHSLEGVSTEMLISSLRRDKKGDSTTAKPILMRDLGSMVQVPVSIEYELVPVIDEYFSTGLHARDLAS